MSEFADAKPPVSVRTGNVLHGKYRLEREIGRGAMGTVWSAIHLTLDQRVAIKIISSDYANSAEAIARFHTEAKAAAKLRSRHVVQVYDDGETPEGLPYIVMEYLEGESLEDRIQREGDLPLAEAVRITSHVGRALSRAHARGIVHRDLKPANIFVTSTDDDEMGWVAKVLDFGIAKLDDNREKSTTKTGTVLGTPLFMSAEQVRGASTVDARADLYSLGMVFYNMITGKYAFEGSSFGDLLVSICTDQLPKLADSAPWASRALEDWFQKACARDPASRFQSADEMVDELHAAANLSFDGRMSFNDDSSVSKMVVIPRERGLRAGDTGNEGKHTYVNAQTHPASELATNTGDASVHTIPGVPVKKRWVLPAVFGGALLVALVGVGWYFASKATLPETASVKEVGATVEAGHGTQPKAPVPAEPVPTAGAGEVAVPTQPNSEGTEPIKADATEAATESTAAAAKEASGSKAAVATATPGKSLSGPTASRSGWRPSATKSTSKSTRPKTPKSSGDVDIGF